MSDGPLCNCPASLIEANADCAPLPHRLTHAQLARVRSAVAAAPLRQGHFDVMLRERIRRGEADGHILMRASIAAAEAMLRLAREASV